MENCIFCKIIRNEIPSTKLFEDKNSLVIAPKEAESKGHMLIIPKKHYENIFDISEKELNNLMSELESKISSGLYGEDLSTQLESWLNSNSNSN